MAIPKRSISASVSAIGSSSSSTRLGLSLNMYEMGERDVALSVVTQLGLQEGEAALGFDAREADHAVDDADVGGAWARRPP